MPRITPLLGEEICESDAKVCFSNVRLQNRFCWRILTFRVKEMLSNYPTREMLTHSGCSHLYTRRFRAIAPQRRQMRPRDRQKCERA